MKKMIIYSLMLVGGFINCEQPNTETVTSAHETQSSKYKDFLKFLEINQRNSELYKALGSVAETTNQLMRAKSKCEANGDCEKSEEFSRLFDDMIKATFEAEKVQERLNFVQTHKEMRDLLTKHRQDL